MVDDEIRHSSQDLLQRHAPLMQDLGQALDAGTAAIVVVGKTSLKEKLEKATAKAVKRIEKQLKGDEKAFEKELAAAEKAVA